MMNHLGRLVFAALVAGLLAGLAQAALAEWRLTPLILQAEHFETAHDHGASVDAAHDHATDHEEDEAWAPADGLERSFYSALASVVTGIGIALIVGAVALVTDLKLTLSNAAIWALAGYASINLAPAFGLPPELPGMPAADLVARQVWWWATALATGIAALIVARLETSVRFVVAAALVLAPHVLGAPGVDDASSALPAHLASAFVAQSLGVALAMWIVLTFALAAIWNRFERAST